VGKGACKAVLNKSFGFKIADCTDNVADNFTMGLAWDVTGGKAIDLDASCVYLDANLQPVDTVWFQQLRSRDGAMQHGGDEREGDEKGDDEKIMFDLERITPAATYLCFCINSFTGQELNDVKDAKCRLYNSITHSECASFDLSADKRLDCSALIMCVLYRVNSDWYMHAVGEPAMGRTVQDNIDEMQAFLRRTPLAQLQASKPPPVAKMAKIQVPAQKAQKVGFRTDTGGVQEVTLPPQAKPGDVMEVPIVEMYIA